MLLVIDVQGGLQVRERVQGALLIFIRPTSLETLEARLRARGTDDEPTIKSPACRCASRARARG